MLAMAHLLQATTGEELEAAEAEESPVPPSPAQTRRRPLFEAHGAPVQSKALAAHMRGFHHVAFETGGESAAPWLSQVQQELAKEGAMPLDGPSLVNAIACLRPPKIRLEERRIRQTADSRKGQAEEDVTPVIFEEPLTCREPVAVAEAKEPIAAAKAPRPTTSDGREIRTPESSSILFSPDPAVLSEASTRCATADKVQVRTVELPKVEAAAQFGSKPGLEDMPETPIAMLSAIYRRGACRPTPLQWPQGRPNAFPGYDGYERRRSNS